MQPLLLITTYPNNSRQLKRFIKSILEQGLAKCVNRFNYVKSYYMREGKMHQDEEKVLLIKTTSKHKDKLTAFIQKSHPYDVPEIVYISPYEVEDKFLQWLTND